MPTVLIGADICPIEANTQYLIRGDTETLFHDLLPEFEAADLVLANLECPLIERPSPIRKTGPTFGEAPSCINGIKAGGIDVLCLANNHILDHGAAGLANTLKVCAEAGIATVGAGRNLAEARKILIRELGGVRVGILAVAEHEFSIATRDSWGANPLDPVDVVRNVRAQWDQFDYLIVLVHGGDEFLVPSPRIKETCRFMIEMGANAVLVQHPHVLGGYEEYQGGHIVYGQGALLMDEAIYRDRKSFHEGFLVKLLIGNDPEVLDPGEVGRDVPIAPVVKSEQVSAALRGVGSQASGTAVWDHAPYPVEHADRPASAMSGQPSFVPGSGHRRLRSRMEIVPLVQSWPPPGARKMTPAEQAEFRPRLEARARAIQDDAFVEAEWLKFCEARENGYIGALLGHNRIVRRLNRSGLLTRWFYGRRMALGLRNLVCCETHREALETILNRRLIRRSGRENDAGL
jgi:poly-gamma-glutamate synthesis protein (capsule biosynthesis protein)